MKIDPRYMEKRKKLLCLSLFCSRLARVDVSEMCLSFYAFFRLSEYIFLLSVVRSNSGSANTLVNKL
jgi:hypothetical protein